MAVITILEAGEDVKGCEISLCGPEVLKGEMQVAGRQRGCPYLLRCCCRKAAKGGVHNVHTLGFGSGRTGAGLGRIPYVWAGFQCLQGLEPGSSPTSGTHNPSTEGFLL
ncbi:hypothetical protein JOE31_002798 [Arthrobacter sp. PvP023]|nr:hypothetical protein [Arthrobacter sp. PvP023]